MQSRKEWRNRGGAWIVRLEERERERERGEGNWRTGGFETSTPFLFPLEYIALSGNSG